MNSRPSVSLSGTPTITFEKLDGKNFLSWSASVELWFLGQGFHNHHEQDRSNAPSDQAEHGIKLIFRFVPYCGSLWNPNYWVPLDRLKCATLFEKKKAQYFC